MFNMLPRINEILAIEFPKVKTRWNNHEVRWVNFSKILTDSDLKTVGNFSKLLNKEIFSQVKTDGRTLFWDKMASIQDYDGTIKPAPLDFCPDVLYQNSELEV